MLNKIAMSAMPTITKTVNNADASARGAFAVGERIKITVDAPRKLGASAVVLRICKDGERDVDYPLTFIKTEAGEDRYRIEIDTEELCCGEGRGLFFYEFLFVRGVDTLFTVTRNQVDFTLETYSAERFVLLVHEKDFETPSWFHGRVMYHIFVDRFCRGGGEIAMRDNVIINEDWDNGIPQYAKKNGDKLANNMFFGGNLWGIAEKLDYLKSLGVGVIYLSPIFRSYSNHKYDTGDYLEIDGMFGGEAAFCHLIEKAREADIRIILDGVFNHTGDDSKYFDKYGTYGGIGAYSNPESPYRDWFCFRKYPKEYEAWWGIGILPKLNPACEEIRHFLAGKGGVAEKYVRMGIGGWRLDVADELTNEFLYELRDTVKGASDDQAVLIGEVWENAALKEAYGIRRRYFYGKQLDSVMNYPVRNGILRFLLEGDAEFLGDVLKEIYATYPKTVCDSLMNLLSTHDTERILTVLGEGLERNEQESNDVLAKKRLTAKQAIQGEVRLKIASVLQYTVFGIPSVFYGDEAGLEGYHDPFCRRPYPWGREKQSILEHYRQLGKIRKEHAVFAEGTFGMDCAENGVIVYHRENQDERIVVIANMSKDPYAYHTNAEAVDLLTARAFDGIVLPESAVILQCGAKRKEKGAHGIVQKANKKQRSQ